MQLLHRGRVVVVSGTMVVIHYSPRPYKPSPVKPWLSHTTALSHMNPRMLIWFQFLSEWAGGRGSSVEYCSAAFCLPEKSPRLPAAPKPYSLFPLTHAYLLYLDPKASALWSTPTCLYLNLTAKPMAVVCTVCGCSVYRMWL